MFSRNAGRTRSPASRLNFLCPGITAMVRRWFIGLSSGSSLLGVDAALVRVDGHGADMALSLEHFLNLPYGVELHELLGAVGSTPAPELRHVGALHRVLGETFALAARKLLEQSRLPAHEVMAVGCSGHKLWHDALGRYPSHLDLGMPSVIAERTGFTTLADFSSRDLAVGGLGMPLTACVDALLFHHPREHRVLLHLGSAATLLYLPMQRGVHGRNIIGFEAAPCTFLLDGLMRLLTSGREAFDAGGKHAVQGRCLESLPGRWMQHSFFDRSPPRCVPRSDFDSDFLNQAVADAKQLNGNLHDVLCTMTHFVARAILHAIRNHVPTSPTRVLLNGRGVRNGFLWRLLEQSLAPTPVEKTDAYGVPAETHHAVAHAGLAALALDVVPLNLPSVTGASGSRLLGHFTPGTSANWTRCLNWMARMAAPSQSVAA